jgi:aminopeptidase N
MVLIILSLCLTAEFSFSNTLFRNKTDVINYKLIINLDFNEKTFTASNKISFIKSTLNKDTLELDISNFITVEKVSSGDLLLGYHIKNKKIFIDISMFNDDTSEITISYKGRPTKFGFYGLIFAEVNKQKIIQTVNQPNYAPTWFPCNDDPSDKAFFEIEILNDSSFVSVSNGKLIEVSTEGSKKKYHYKTFYPIATNLIGFYSSNYVVIKDDYKNINGKNLELYYYIFPNDTSKAKIDLSITKDILETFENLFGEYPFIEEKFSVSEILLTRAAIENQTIVGISKDLFSGRNFHQDILIHEIAHSWWGNAVGISDWKDIWLSEALATYSEVLYYESSYGSSGLHSQLNKFLNESFSGRVYNPDNLFGKQVYYKSALVLNMIRNILSDSVFFNFLKNYYKEFKYKNVTTEDFKKFLEVFSGKDFTKFFEDWIYNDKGIINCSYYYDEKNNLFTITQNDNTFDFQLEVKLLFEDLTEETLVFNVNDVQEEFEIKSNRKIKEIIIDPYFKLLGKFYQTK